MDIAYRDLITDIHYAEIREIGFSDSLVDTFILSNSFKKIPLCLLVGHVLVIGVA